MKQEDVTLISCSVCGERYRTGSAKIVGSRNNSLIVHIHCGTCYSSTLTIISKNSTGENTMTMGMLTDLSYNEAVESMNMRAIDADEVLDIIEETR